MNSISNELPGYDIWKTNAPNTDRPDELCDDSEGKHDLNDCVYVIDAHTYVCSDCLRQRLSHFYLSEAGDAELDEYPFDVTRLERCDRCARARCTCYDRRSSW